jgi:hypothetical protein
MPGRLAANVTNISTQGTKVFLDGQQYRFDPTADAYRPQQ